MKFIDLLESMALTQHARTPTNESGHTFNNTRELNNIVLTTPISGCFMSDPRMVLCKLTDKKQPLLTKEVRFRKIKSIDIESFKRDIRSTTVCLEPP